MHPALHPASHPASHPALRVSRWRRGQLPTLAGVGLVLAVLALGARAQSAEPIHDPANPALGQLQPAATALPLLPQAKRGGVDWARSVRDGAIAPRADLEGRAKATLLSLDVILKNTKDMPHVLFPHLAHTQWLSCANCHDQLFVPKAGANQINMDKIFRGQYCGACHGRVAFVTHLNCERCHSIPHSGAKAWW